MFNVRHVDGHVACGVTELLIIAVLPPQTEFVSSVFFYGQQLGLTAQSPISDKIF